MWVDNYGCEKKGLEKMIAREHTALTHNDALLGVVTSSRIAFARDTLLLAPRTCGAGHLARSALDVTLQEQTLITRGHAKGEYMYVCMYVCM
jgi:hypothetical protein